MLTGQFPTIRMRRMRRHPWLRALTQEHHLSVKDLVWPLFVQDGHNRRDAVVSMPGVERFSIDVLLQEVEQAAKIGIPAVALFPVIEPNKKDEQGSEALNADNIIARALRAIKKNIPEIGVICDVALDPYTTHGQDGVVKDGYVENDVTIEKLAQQALCLAEAGCDIVAPSDMMDGRVGGIRGALDQVGFQEVAILSYAAKYASHFYGPFRDAVGSKTALQGDKKTYQMDPASEKEAMREVALDIAEGADIIMIKPGMPYLDVLARVRDQYDVPLAVYQVSGEYAMIKAAQQAGWLAEDVLLESLIGFKRAGANMIFTYGAMEIARSL